MAVTKIWAVRDSLQRVLDYAANPQKTALAGDGLAPALHYAGNDAKTRLAADMDGEQVLLVTGIHCRTGQAWAHMRAVQRKFGKTEGVVAMHAYQSFQPGEVTPEQCHAIGVELARRVWGGRFQVLVATHQNTNCLHNHFVINSVSYVDGKKYEQRRSQYAELRAASDEICRKYRLSVLEQPGGKMSRALYQAEHRGEPTRYAQMQAAIRYAMRETSTEADFAAVLRERGFVWQHDPRRKHPTVRPVDGGRAVRIYRLGEGFDWPATCRALAQPVGAGQAAERAVAAVHVLLLPVGHLSQAARAAGELAGDSGHLAGYRAQTGRAAVRHRPRLCRSGRGARLPAADGGARRSAHQTAGCLRPGAAAQGPAARCPGEAGRADPSVCGVAAGGPAVRPGHRPACSHPHLSETASLADAAGAGPGADPPCQIPRPGAVTPNRMTGLARPKPF